MRGFRRGPRIDEEEWALTESRTAARLTDIFGIPAPEQTAEPEPAEPEQAEPASDEDDGSVNIVLLPRLIRPRPPIVVIGDAGEASEPAQRPADPEPVGVMAVPADDLGDGGWSLLVGAGLFADVAPPPLRRARPARQRSAKAKSPQPVAAAEVAPVAVAPEVPPAAKRAGPPRPANPVSATAATKVMPAASCPYCALVLEPPPTASRRCTGCLQRIVVKRVDGRAVYLTEAALLIFDAERRRAASSVRLGRERDRWLRLATAAGAPAERIARLSAARLTEDGVSAARTLYVSAVDRAFRAARRDLDWEKAARIRRDNATELYRIAGSPTPPPPDILALFREGVAAELRGIAEISRDAELVAAGCCDVCRSDDHRIFRIAAELRQPRLPHDGCPRGLCRCRWDLAARDRTTMLRYLKRRSGSES
jgi:hypothetical protein